MKKTKKIVASLATLAFVLSGSVVSASTPCVPHTETIVSDTTNTVFGDGNAVAVVPHVAWTAAIPGSTTWIWKSSATGVDEIVRFEKSFTVIGTVLSAQLDIASDNSYEVFIDNVSVAVDTNAINFTTVDQDVHNLTANVTSGVHTLRIDVKNVGTYDVSSNPAGLLYKLVVNSEECCPDPNCCNGDVTVTNTNNATVVNNVVTVSNTGGNTANGGSAGASANGINNNNNSSTGGKGGTVTTGKAKSVTVVKNKVNTNKTKIK